MPYFRNNQGDLVDDAGVVVTNPATRLEISQSIGGELNNLPIWTPPATLAPTNPLDNRTLPESLSLGTLTAEVNVPPVTSPYSTPALIEEERKRAEAQRRIVSGQFDTLDEEARLRGEAEKGGAKLGTGRLRWEGFSSAAEAYLQNVQTQSEKRMERLRNDRQTALASLDMESARNISALMQKENERQDKLSEIKFNRLEKLMRLEFDIRADARAEENQNIANTEKVKQFALDNAINKSAYQIGGVTYDSQTGQIADANKFTADQIQIINADTKNARDHAKALNDKFPDANILPTDDDITIQGKLNASKMYRKDTYIASTKTISPEDNPKLVTETVRNKYNLPDNITQGQLNKVKQFIKENKDAVEGGFGKLTVAERYGFWGEVADELTNAGFNPTDFDALLWEEFSPDGLKGYNTYVRGTIQPKTNGKKPSAGDRFRTPK